MLLDQFARGRVGGTTHTCIGQEIAAVAVTAALDRSRDCVFSNHRGHGHFLAYCGEMFLLLAEILGRPDGVCGGRGGSQHLHLRNFYSNGVQGGTVGNAVGVALAEKRKRSGAVTCVWLGDGTFGEGLVYEAMNLAALWRLPIVFAIEANRIAQTTPTELQLAGSIAARCAAFDIPVAETSGTDVEEMLAAASRAVDAARAEQRPQALVSHAIRLGPHSKGDDTRAARSAAGGLGERSRREVAPEGRQRRRDDRSRGGGADARGARRGAGRDRRAMTQTTVLASLNAALRAALAADERVIVLGEDVLDPYGGAFKVTRGLSSEFPDRVLATPISEAGIVAAATGVALRGLRPVVEIMFGDFLFLAGDQIVNHAAKYRAMFNDQVRVPLVVRTPAGGRRGYGPTHSQSLEKHFLGVPGLWVVAPHALLDPGALLRQAIFDVDDPVLFVENKIGYGEPLRTAPPGYEAVRLADAASPFPTLWLKPRGPADGLLLCYGGMTRLALDAAALLREREKLDLGLVVVSQLAPTPADPSRRDPVRGRARRRGHGRGGARRRRLGRRDDRDDRAGSRQPPARRHRVSPGRGKKHSHSERARSRRRGAAAGRRHRRGRAGLFLAHIPAKCVVPVRRQGYAPTKNADGRADPRDHGRGAAPAGGPHRRGHRHGRGGELGFDRAHAHDDRARGRVRHRPRRVPHGRDDELREDPQRGRGIAVRPARIRQSP